MNVNEVKQQPEQGAQEEQLQARQDLEEAERQLRARVHRHMGMSAAVLGLIAAVVGFWLLASRVGISPWAALREAMPLFLIVLVILGAGVVVSLGTSRVAYGIERLLKRTRQEKTGD